MTLIDLSILGYFLAANTIYLILFVVSFYAMARYHLRARFSTPNEILKAKITPPVSILLPAYNEGKNILDSVGSLDCIVYPEYEIVVVNDGSTDDTLQRLIGHFKLRRTARVYHQVVATQPVRGIYRSEKHPRLVVVDKENGGKADALNAGVNVSAYPLYCALDADSILEKEALLKIIYPFMEAYAQTAAVGGIIRAANGSRIENGKLLEARLSDRWLVNFQVVEYLRAFLSGRMGWSLFNSLLVISGAFGIFNKEMALSVGGYKKDCIGEDMELVVRMHEKFRENKQKRFFHFIPDPVCWTEVPESWNVLIRQRNRWQRGLAESLAAHIKMLFNPRFGVIGLAAMPYFLLIECLSPLVELIGYVHFGAALFQGRMAWQACLLFFTLAVLFGILFSLLAILMEEAALERYSQRRDLTRMILSGVAENFGYRQLLSWVRVKGLWDFALGRKAWGAMERTGLGANARV